MRNGRTTAVVAMALALALASCGDGGKEQGPPAVKADAMVGMRLDPKEQNAEVKRNIAVQGRWESAPSKEDKDRHVAIDVAGTSEYTLDLIGREGGQEAIYASGRGSLTWTPEGLLKATGQADEAIGRYSTWTAGFPANDVMTVRTTRGDVEFRRKTR